MDKNIKDGEELQSEDVSQKEESSEVPGEGVEGAGESSQASVETSGKEDFDEGEEEEGGNFEAIFEALLFLSNEPLPLTFFTKHLELDKTDAKIVLDSLVDEYEERDGGLKLVEISGGYQFVTNPKYAKQIRRVLGFKRKEPLTKGMLETLAIIAYKQPVILAEVEELRGVSSRMMVANLMKRNLIKPVGRKELPGRPLAYGTTDEFLRTFGLNKLTDLPKLSEIKEFSYESDLATGE